MYLSGSIALVYLVTTLSIGLALASVNQLTPTLIAASLLACIPATIRCFVGRVLSAIYQPGIVRKTINGINYWHLDVDVLPCIKLKHSGSTVIDISND